MVTQQLGFLTTDSKVVNLNLGSAKLPDVQNRAIKT